MGSEQSSHQHEKSYKNETKEIYDDGFSHHSETVLATEHELVSDASKASSTLATSRKHMEDRDIVERTLYQHFLDCATSIVSPAEPPSTIIASSCAQNESSFMFKAGSNIQYDATVQTNVIAIQDRTPASFGCVWDVSNEESSSHVCEARKASVLVKSEHFSPQRSPSEPYESASFSSVVKTQMTQLSPTAPTHPLPLKSAVLSSNTVPFYSSVDVKVASKPLHLNSTFATLEPCHGVFPSSHTTDLSQLTDVLPVPMTSESMCSSKKTAFNLHEEESSNLTASHLSTTNNNISNNNSNNYNVVRLEQLLCEAMKKLIDVDVVLQCLKGENMSKQKRKMLCKQMSMLSYNLKMVLTTWDDIMKMTNNEALTANKTVNKHQVPEKGELENGGKQNTVQNDKSSSVVEVHDEDTMKSYLGEHSWQIVKDTSEVGIRDNLFYCNICKTKLSGFANVAHFEGKMHGKELKNCLALVNKFFIVGDKGHCKLCNTEIPRTLRDIFDHINGTRHKRKLQENCTDPKMHAVEGGKVATNSRQILQNVTYNSRNWEQLSWRSETPARHDQLLAKVIANPSRLLTSKFVGFYCEPCNCFSYGNNVAKHAKKSAHLVSMKKSETNRILFCGTCKIVLWGTIDLLVQHKMSAGHIEIQHLY